MATDGPSNDAERFQAVIDATPAALRTGKMVLDLLRAEAGARGVRVASGLSLFGVLDLTPKPCTLMSCKERLAVVVDTALSLVLEISVCARTFRHAWPAMDAALRREAWDTFSIELSTTLTKVGLHGACMTDETLAGQQACWHLALTPALPCRLRTR